MELAQKQQSTASPVPNRSLLILGMHRSGTSMLSHWLHASGIALGEHLYEDAAFNAKGHFEDLEFLELHKWVLRKLRMDDRGIVKSRPLSPDDVTVRPIRSFLESMSADRLIAWKDPRTVLFLPIYEQLLPDMYSISIFRHYALVVDSCMRRNRRARARELSASRYKRFIDALKRVKNRILGIDRDMVMSKHYLQAWITYNKIILQHVRSFKERSLLILLDELEELTPRVYSSFDQWNIPYHPIPYRDIFDPSLLRKDAELSIDDKRMIVEAEAVYQELRLLRNKPMEG